MKLGLALPSYGNDGWRFPPTALRRFVNRAEAAGFGGLWAMEHLTRPPERAYNRLDPLTTLASIAGETERIPIGTSVLLLPLRNPVLVAHRVATLQHLSDDRLTLGLGLGWSEAEYAAAGVPFEERGRRFTEGLTLLTRLLREDTVTFEGEFYDVEDVRLEPPTPRPPRILVGGSGVERDGQRRVPRPIKERILNHADGWLAPPRSTDIVATDWAEIETYLEENGRDPATLDRVALNRAYVVPGVDAERALEKQRRVFERRGSAESGMARSLTGSVAEIREDIALFREMGFDELVLDSVTGDPTDAERQLEVYEEQFADLV